LRSDARLEVLDSLRTTHDWIKRYGADDASNDEVRADVTQVVRTRDQLTSKLALDAHIHLVDHRVLESVVNDINAARSCSGQHKAGEGVRQSWSAGRKDAVDRVKKELGRDEEEIARTHLNRQGAPIKPALQRLDFQCHAIVVDAITAVNACPPVFGRVVKSEPGRKIVFVSRSLTIQERQN
jgi:hypothetical protein